MWFFCFFLFFNFSKFWCCANFGVLILVLCWFWCCANFGVVLLYMDLFFCGAIDEHNTKFTTTTFKFPQHHFHNTKIQQHQISLHKFLEQPKSEAHKNGPQLQISTQLSYVCHVSVISIYPPVVSELHLSVNKTIQQHAFGSDKIHQRKCDLRCTRVMAWDGSHRTPMHVDIRDQSN